ncbi:hypothetical protein GCM10020219_061110 [Nonomuraea dietziae]
MGEVDRGDLDALTADVVPDVELGPVRQREDPDVLALADARVVEVPQFGTLILRVPLAELVAEGEHPLLGAGLLLVAPGTTEDRVELVVLDRVEQRGGLQAVARGAPPCLLGDAAGVDGVLDAGHHQPGAELGGAPVTELDDLGEVVPGVDVHEREGDRRRPEGLLRDAQHHDGVLATGEEQTRALELRRHLTHDVDGLGLENVELRRGVVALKHGGFLRH